MKKLFAPFRRKLMLEALCKSLLMGLLAASSVELVFLIVMHLIPYNPGWLWIGCVFAVPFLLTFLILFAVLYYPTDKRIARRIDQSGLAERAGTMLEFKDQNSTILELQRADAVQRIQNFNIKDLPFRIAPKVMIACAAVLLLSAGSMFVPYDFIDLFRAEAASVSREEEAMILSLLENLRKITAEGDISGEHKDQLYDVFDELEEDLNRAVGEFDRAAQISESEMQIKDGPGRDVTKEELGAALRQFASTSDLGKAIEKGDIDAASVALEKTKNDLLALETDRRAERLARIASDIKKALDMTGGDGTDRLYAALDAFRDRLDSAAEAASGGKNVSDEIIEAVDKAKEEIRSALEEQNKLDGVLDQLIELLTDAKKSILNADFPSLESETVSEDSPETEAAETEQNPSETDEAGKDKEPGSEDSEGDNGDAENSDSQYSEDNSVQSGEPSDGSMTYMREEIYDPALGNVAYGDVFAAYYAEYLTAVGEGKIAEDMQAMLEKYFDSLGK